MRSGQRFSYLALEPEEMSPISSKPASSYRIKTGHFYGY
jgi:hypothetical protein